jgi:hypothetical protein
MEESKELSCYTYSINVIVSVVAKDEKEAEERVESGLGYLVDRQLTIVNQEKLQFKGNNN